MLGQWSFPRVGWRSEKCNCTKVPCCTLVHMTQVTWLLPALSSHPTSCPDLYIAAVTWWFLTENCAGCVIAHSGFGHFITQEVMNLVRKSHSGILPAVHLDKSVWHHFLEIPFSKLKCFWCFPLIVCFILFFKFKSQRGHLNVNLSAADHTCLNYRSLIISTRLHSQLSYKS